MSAGNRALSTPEERCTNGGPQRRASALACWALLLLVPTAIPAAPTPKPAPPRLAPRPISEAERAGIELALRYLEGGAALWWDRLADDAPLRRLGREEAIREITVRLGPVDGAKWELRTWVDGTVEDLAVFTISFPSGADETARLLLRRQSSEWHLVGLETTVDPIAAPTTVASSSRPLSRPGPLTLLLVGAVLSWSAIRRPRSFAAAALALLAAGSELSCGGDRARHASSGEAALLRLAPLSPLRLAMTGGGDFATALRDLAGAKLSPELSEVQRLWEADERLRQGDLPKAAALLRQSPHPSRFPFAELLRARLALAQLSPADTAKAYDEAASLRLDHDGLHIEAAEARAVTDDDAGAAFELHMLAVTGSRAAEAWYGAARAAVLEDRESEAEELLRVAWTLRPLPRRELFADPLLATAAAKPALFPLLQLASPFEPRASHDTPRRPLSFPAGCAVTTCGAALRAHIRGARLELPGGASLAPDGAVVVDAPTWADEDELRALSRLAELKRAALLLPSNPSKRVVREAELAGSALARQNRWRDLEELTAPFAAANPPAVLLARLRALALSRLERAAEARELLVRVATAELARRAPASGTLYDLAELLAKAGDFDRAMQLVRKADARRHRSRSELRLRQLALDQLLAKSFRSFRSQHFDIRYPITTGEKYARQIATVLERERQREAQWVPLGEGPHLEVNLFDLQPFFNAYGQMGVVGLYDGRVRVPFADLQSLHPELVRILSHELCHALIAQATHDRAPAWFHEGLAQHVEMGTSRTNPLPDLQASGRAIAFPVVNAILAGFAEEQFIELAYAESAWAVSFLEARWGNAGLRHLMAAFAAGKTDEQALREVTGLDLAAFDRAFWDWGAHRAPAVRELPVFRFDLELDGPVRRSSTQLAAPVGRAEHGARGSGAAPGTPPSMSEWHSRYSARISNTRQAIIPILVAYQKGQIPAAAATCARLEGEVATLRNDASLFECPERKASRALRDAYYQLQQMLGHCKVGRHDLARGASTRAAIGLRSASQALAPYGVEP